MNPGGAADWPNTAKPNLQAEQPMDSSEKINITVPEEVQQKGQNVLTN